jgi:spore coat polysaccharide biosynthesis predicted glycosyltransferase SpsG
LPNIFWCWGKESAREINKWANTTNRHRAIVVGNPWISRFIDKEGYDKNNFQQNETKNILVAIPNKELSVIENIIEAFKKSPPNIKWHLRLHPTRLASGQREELAEKLKKTNNLNSEIKRASTETIFEILRNMDFVITPWSTTAYEALAMNVHPIITSDDDKAVFENYVNQGFFSIALTSEKILEIIKRDKSEFNFKEKTPYMETDREKMKKILLDLLEKRG